MDLESEVLINISFRLPMAHPEALAEQVGPVIKEAVLASYNTVHFSMQPYTPEEDNETS